MGCGSSNAVAASDSNAGPNLKSLVKKSKLPLSYIEDLYERIKKVSEDGKLTSSQFTGLMEVSNGSSLEKFLNQLFNAFKAKGSNTMSFEELIMMLSVIMQGSLKSRLEAIFRICDSDGSGQIEKAELVSTFKNMMFLVKNEDKINVDDMEDLAEIVFDETDRDKNGHLTKREFLEAFAKNERVKSLITVIFVAVVKALKKD